MNLRWWDDDARRCDHLRSRRHIRGHHRVGADERAIADRHIAQDHGASPKLHAAPQPRRFPGALMARSAQGHALANQTVIADLRVIVHDDRALVADHHPPSHLHGVVQFDAVMIANVTIKDAIQKAQRNAQESRAHIHAPHAEAVHRQRSKPRAGPVAAVEAPILAEVRPQAEALRNRLLRL